MNSRGGGCADEGDAALGLQHNVPLDTIKNALTREGNGEPSTIIGAVVDRLLQGG